jgi:hypothetical protein
MERPVDAFRADLERFYKAGFRPVTVSEYLDNKMDLPPGASPVVFTFDDANPSQFQLLPDGSVDPNCGMGVWKAFAEKHPDFPIKATFYVIPQMWGQADMIEKKVAMLREWGSELGNHTWDHYNLKTLTDDKVKEQLAKGADLCAKYGESGPLSLALPLGVFPKNRELVKGFEYKGKQYKIKAAMLVGANPAQSPTSEKFDPYRVARIQATTDDYGLDYWMDRFDKGEVKVYVQP